MIVFLPMTLETLTSGPRAYLVLLCLAAALYLPGIASMPVTDRDEARFAQATRQMVETGDYVNIRFQNKARAKKPAGIHWLQAAAVKGPGGGDTSRIWPFRLPSALGAAAAVLALFAFAVPGFGRTGAFIGAVLLGSAAITVIEAHIAKTDAVLLFTMVVMQGALLNIYRLGRCGDRAPPWLAGLFWCGLAAGILIKGPILPAVAAMTVLTLLIADRRAGLANRLIQGLHPFWGVPLCALLVAPWFVAVSLHDDSFLATAVSQDILPRFLGDFESHGAPPGTYLAVAPLTYWPGVLLVPFGLIWAWRNRADPAARFCLAWLIPSWIALELVPTKLVHYSLPLYPAAALLAAAAATQGKDWLVQALAHKPARLWLVIWSSAGLILAALAPGAGHHFEAAVPWVAWGAAGAGLIAVGVGLAGALKGDAVLAALGPAPMMILLMGLILGAAMPQIPSLWPSARAKALVAAHQTAPRPPVAAVGYHEPSLVFRLGTATLLTRAAGAARHVTATPGALALIEARDDRRFREALAVRGHTALPLGSVKGFNTAKGRSITLTLYRARPLKR